MSVLGCGTARVDRVAPVLLVALSCAGLMACQGITVTTAPGASGAVTTSAVAAAPGTAAPGTATKGSATKGSATNGSAAKGSAAKGAGAPATAVLAGLAVKGRAPMTGYQRTLFGGGWADEDHDGCSTR